MRIKEVAEQTGLTISNIRFYEKKGLIRPEREQQSKYRDYAPEDVRRLKLIVLYRKMNLSLETIGELLAERLRLEDALERQLDELRGEQRRLQGSIDLCEKLAADYASGAAFPPSKTAERRAMYDFDVDRYLNYVKEEEATGHPFAEAEELLEDFAEFTQYDRVMLSSGLYAWLSRHLWLNRALSVVWCLFWLLFPVFVIVDDCVNRDGISAGAVVFWGAWLLLTGISFVRFWTVKKKKRN